MGAVMYFLMPLKIILLEERSFLQDQIWYCANEMAGKVGVVKERKIKENYNCHTQGCIFRLTCSHPELTQDHVLTSAYVKVFRTVTRNAVNKSV